MLVARRKKNCENRPDRQQDDCHKIAEKIRADPGPSSGAEKIRADPRPSGVAEKILSEPRQSGLAGGLFETQFFRVWNEVFQFCSEAFRRARLFQEFNESLS